MALKNNKDDQKERSWGDKLRRMFNKETTGRSEKMKKIKSPEDAVKKLRKYKRP